MTLGKENYYLEHANLYSEQGLALFDGRGCQSACESSSEVGTENETS